MNKKIFDIDYNKLVILLLPTFLRRPLTITWLQALVLPIKQMYSVFTNNRANNMHKLVHNGQVCYLRKALNDAFDPGLRRIYIGDGNKYKRWYIYTNVEQKPEYLGKLYLHQVGDYADTGLDFTVIVPTEFDLKNYQMRGLIDFYKLASKRYDIQHE